MRLDLSRREMLQLTVGAGAGLVLGVRPAASAGPAIFNPFVRISPDGLVTVIAKHLDKGQGAATGLATLVAEELNASPDQVTAEFAPADARTYKNFAFGDQGTGGSTAMSNSFGQYRHAGAVAREMLLQAAADRWRVPKARLSIALGRVNDPITGQSAGIGLFAADAARLTPPENPPLKDPSQWTLIGKHFPRVEVAAKSAGSVGLYGMDMQRPDMLVATIARSPAFGGKVRDYDAEATLNVRGVVGVVEIPSGIAVLARSTWPAIKGRAALKITWDNSAAETQSSADILALCHAKMDEPGLPTQRHDDASPALDRATQVIEATYEFPYLAHAPMEPLDVTVHLRDDSADFWTGSQLQTPDQMAAARVLGLDPDRIAIHTTWAGGSFGRRGVPDAHYVAEAAELARAWRTSQPIKIVHTREDDIQGGYYRPAYVHKVRAGVDATGRISGWQHRIAGQSIIEGTPYEAYIMRNGIDRLSVEGVENTTYDIPAMNLELHTIQSAIPVLWWRSVGHTHTAYVVETMIERLAIAAGQDPVAFRLAHLRDDPRLSGVLQLVADKADWHRPSPHGRFRGVAVHRSFGTCVAEIAEISLRDEGTVKVEKVTVAVDCGVAINPDNVRAQIEGSIGYGLGAVLRNQITLTGGVPDQTNFDSYEPLRITDMPEIEVHIVPSAKSPTGAGEPGTPPIGPAVANAVLRATGKAVTLLPFSRHNLA